MRKLLIGVTLTGICVGSWWPARGQMGMSNARSLALGGAYIALARGVEAPRWNPANLGLRDTPAFSMNLVAAGAAVFNNSFSKKDYELYNGAYLTPAMKSDILGKIPEEGLRLNVDSEVEALGLSWRRFALNVSAEAASRLRLSRQFIDVALNGNQLDRTYDFSDTGGEAFAISTIGLSYGQRVFMSFCRDFAIGATFKYVRGLGQAEVLHAYGKMNTTYDGVFGDARTQVRYAAGGSGFASDLGVAAVLSSKWAVGLAVRNWWSAVRWTREVTIAEYGVRLDSLTVEAVDGASVDSLVDDYSTETPGVPYSTRLPAELRLGCAYRSGKLLLAADYVQGFQNRPGVSSKPQVAAGVELRLLNFLPVRMGVSFGGSRGASSGVGFGLRLGTFEMQFAAASWGGILPRAAGGVGLALGMRVGV